MADTVVDKLWNIPPGAAWQNNADTSDTNRPQPGDLVRPGTETSIDGNIRRIKSDMRQFTLDPAWVNYLGLATAPSPNAPNRVNDTRVTLESNWQNIATLGRMLRSTTFTSGDPNQPVKSASPILFVEYDDTVNLTSITVRDPIFGANTGGNWVDGQSYVEFAAIDPSDAGVGTHSATTLVPVPFPIGSSTPTTFVLPIESGGTGNITGASSAAGGPAGGDLDGDYPDPTVVKIQGEPVDATVIIPADRTNADVLGWDVEEQRWQPRDVANALAVSPAALIQAAIASAFPTRINNPTDGGQGYLTVPAFALHGPGGTAQNVDVIVQWATLVVVGDPTEDPHFGKEVPFQLTFPTQCVFAQATIYVDDGHVAAYATVKSVTVEKALVNYLVIQHEGPASQVTLSVFAIGY